MADKCTPISRSSVIDRVCYDAADGVLTLRLKGEDFAYAGVSQRTVEELLRSKSMGKFFNARIRE